MYLQVLSDYIMVVDWFYEIIMSTNVGVNLQVSCNWSLRMTVWGRRLKQKDYNDHINYCIQTQPSVTQSANQDISQKIVRNEVATGTIGHLTWSIFMNHIFSSEVKESNKVETIKPTRQVNVPKPSAHVIKGVLCIFQEILSDQAFHNSSI